jgi:hypothetical protein
MDDYQQDNPYASPKGASEPVAAEVVNVWRDGDELVCIAGGMKAPEACWVTNRTRFLSPCHLNCQSRVGLGLFALIFIPFVGFFLFLLALLPAALLGFVRLEGPIARLSVRTSLNRAGGTFLSGVLILAAIGTSLAAAISMSLLVALVSVPLRDVGAISVPGWRFFW